MTAETNLAIKPWLFEFMQGTPTKIDELTPEEVKAVFDANLALWLEAEQLNYEGVFFSEHHFWVSYSPSPNLLVASLAAQTSRLRLGVMGMVLPFYEPYRILEEIFMLDHLTDGRLEIGCSMGVPAEFSLLGMEMLEMRERFDELLEIVDAGLESPVITHHGKYWNFDNLAILPRPLQQPAPTKWTTVVSPGSAAKSAGRGSKISTGFSSVGRVKEIFDAYRDSAADAGFDATPGHLGVRRHICISHDEDEAQEWKATASGVRAGLLASDPRAKFGDSNKVLDAPPGGSGFEVHDDDFIAGTPEQVAEQIIEQTRTLECQHILVTHGVGPSTSRADGLRLFGNEVIPVISKASVGQAAVA
jgi:alkanesulfonate monooxygenase SsuD/methylene tetrahydromethanopterin reductase-like flavin-dependent oxidoreductase (luciferase family)